MWKMLNLPFKQNQFSNVNLHNIVTTAVLQDLLFSYNIAVDRTDEMKKVLGKSAASVGLQLPEVYQP